MSRNSRRFPQEPMKLAKHWKLSIQNLLPCIAIIRSTAMLPDDLRTQQRTFKELAGLVPDPAAFVTKIRGGIAAGWEIVFQKACLSQLIAGPKINLSDYIGQLGCDLSVIAKFFRDGYCRHGLGTGYILRIMALVGRGKVEQVPTSRLGCAAGLMRSTQSFVRELHRLTGDPIAEELTKTKMLSFQACLLGVIILQKRCFWPLVQIDWVAELAAPSRGSCRRCDPRHLLGRLRLLANRERSWRCHGSPMPSAQSSLRRWSVTWQNLSLG